jgi:NADPH:quinone reductase-like Zn-dependent oxidoreductase
MGAQFGQGTFSQYINFSPSSTPVVKKPNCFSHEAAASIPLVALTAYACLDWLPPPSGTSQRRAVIQGASGGTGSWLVQR